MFRSAGFAIGILVGLILVIIFYRFANTNHKAKTEYDERQKEIRGRAYQYAFYAMIIYEVIMLMLEISELPLPLDSYILHFAGILIGCLVLACYCIWKDVYWGLNNNRRRYVILFLLTAVLNAIPVIGALQDGSLIIDGKPSVQFINLLILVMLLIISAELLIKHLLNQREVES